MKRTKHFDGHKKKVIKQKIKECAKAWGAYFKATVSDIERFKEYYNQNK